MPRLPFFWQPNWIATPPEEWDRKIDALLEKDSWVMDGNYRASLSRRLEYADTVVFLDRGRVRSLLRCVGRYLKYRGKNEPALTGLERVSKPGLRVYAQHKEIPRVYGGLGVAILSTPQGVMTGQQAWRKGIGGELLCYVW